MASRFSIELQLQHINPSPPKAALTRPSSPDTSHDGLEFLTTALSKTPRQRPATPPSEPEAAPDGAHELPPVDRGRGAYMFLVCCFVMETLVWGKSILKLPESEDVLC